MDKEEIIETGMTKRDALNFLIVDETEAISGYDKVLKACDWDESDRIELERLRNAEIDHISDLSKIFNKHSTANIVGTDSVEPDAVTTEGEQPVQDAKEYKYWLTNGDWGGARCILYFENAVPESVARETAKSHKVLQENLFGYDSMHELQKTTLKLQKEEGEDKTETKLIEIRDMRPTVKWRMHQDQSGYYYFKSPDGDTYKENGIEVRFASKVPAGEFFATTLFNRSLWGNEVPRVIKDAPAAGNVVKVDGGWAITSDKGWWTVYNPNGFFKFSSTEFSNKTVFKTEEEARKVAAKMLKSVYGISDAKLTDYQARGSFGSIGELKSHYAGASLRPKSGGMTVILKSGAELEYSYGDGGTLVFIRGRN